MSILKDIIGRFNPFITFPLFLLGIIFLLIGITTEVNIPIQGGVKLIAEQSSRAISIMIGSACIILCLILNLVYKKPTVISNGPDDLKKPLLNRAADLSTRQGAILQHVRAKTENSSLKLSQMDLARQFNIEGEEMYYRLEQLVLLGLVAKTFISTQGHRGANFYHLSDSYRKALTISSSSRRG